ncbi:MULTISPECIES: glycoside hydrolase family 99-like domain-containing protein [unclassified Caulobacter]|uniref:glycoside hydrolase family 99-like domain-containing protein n=1 Tax=unclassified Caulobacter TaxID=2648921 RepID=UPI00070011DA|nr:MULTISPECIES: glycoside hydrolase family 99-like domain-containing protein [unclassified Caulobacter]KQV55610.1 rhamnan synthesis protein F [Caulobacter sp. Root342]KQV63459.1 rhamnan synthesis protein F [Caulobacter sp. Root343]
MSRPPPKPVFGGLKPGRDVAVQGLDAQGRTVLAAARGDPQMVWTATRAERAALRAAKAVRIDVKLEAVEGQLVGPALYADWGDGFSEDSYTRLKAGPDGWFASLPARSWQLNGVRLDPSEGACAFVVADFKVSRVGDLGKDPRGLKGAAIQAIKPLLGPLRKPAGAAWRRGRAMLDRARASRPAAGGDSGPVRATYTHAIRVAKNLRSPHYAAPIAAPIALPADAPKVVAFYLPQFHPFPENDAWWGKGFTEWTNVSKAQPQFLGHYQPRLPADLGFYDLRQREVIAQQIDLAKGAGVHAFCFHYYWFAGKRLLERPIELFLADSTLDLPFALCWANENWTRRWDGDESDILMGQDHSPEDDEAVFEDMARYIRDPRYLKVGGKPVLVLYRPEILPDSKATTDRWRSRARAMGIGELHLLCTTAFGFQDHAGHGFDGIIDFPPHAIVEGEITKSVTPLHPNFTGKVYDYPTVVQHKLDELEQADAAFVPGVMPGWDNQARKPWAGHAFHNADPESYLRWLSGALKHAETKHPKGQGLAFVNAWNEWGEGAYLEPDRWFGHGYLHATRAALGAYLPRLTDDHPLVAEAQRGFVKRAEAVTLLHLFYPELIDWFAERLAATAGVLDLMITVPEAWGEADLAKVRAAFPRAHLAIAENRGRDIRPFVETLRRARALGYSVFCKLHSKRSPHQPKGDQWRAALVDGLLGGEATALALRAFAQDPKLGLLASSEARMRMGDPDVMDNNRPDVERLSARMGLKPRPETPFAAGSMFWGRTEAFAPLTDLTDAELGFGPELGRVDGTTAHAIERLTAAIVSRAGYRASFEL